MAQKNFSLNFLNRIKDLVQAKVPRIWQKVVVVLFVLLVGGGISYLVLKDREDKTKSSSTSETNKKIASLLPKVDCSKYSNDSDALMLATNDGNIIVCDCIKDAKIKTKCIKDATDVSYQNEAVTQCNPDLCKKISDQQQAQYCESGVKEFISKMDSRQLSNCTASSGNYNASIQSYQASININSSDVEALLGLATAYTNKALMERKESEYIPKALELVEKADKIRPNNPKTYYAKGFAYEVKPEYSSALAAYNKALELDKNYVYAYIGRGHTYNLLGMLNNALEDFEKAQSLDKNRETLEIYNQICRLAASDDDKIHKAIDSCKIVLASSKASTVYKIEAHLILTDLYLRTYNDNEAHSQLKQAETLGPQNTNTLVMFARYYVATKDYDKAVEYANKAINLDMKKSMAYLWLAQAHYFKESYNPSIETAEKGLSIIANDISLIGLNRNAVKRDLNLTIADCYQKLKNSAKEKEYRDLANKF